VNVIETERLMLSRLTADDAQFILQLVNEPAFVRYIGDRGVRTLDDARRYLEAGPLASYARRGFGMYRVSLKAGDIPIGICGLIKRDGLEDVDIGFAFLPAYWDRGYASESAGAVMRSEAAALGLTRIVAITTPDNLASIRVVEKLGLRFERTVRLQGNDAELCLFGIDMAPAPDAAGSPSGVPEEQP
jgi:RimJ/RimL family protein N-acetyltransferase